MMYFGLLGNLLDMTTSTTNVACTIMQLCRHDLQVHNHSKLNRWSGLAFNISLPPIGEATLSLLAPPVHIMAKESSTDSTNCTQSDTSPGKQERHQSANLVAMYLALGHASALVV